MVTRESVAGWLDQLKAAWEAKDVDRAVELFEHTNEYFERPFKAGTTRDEIRGYWQDIVSIDDIVFDYEIIAIEGPQATIHWSNSFVDPSSGQRSLLDGVFWITFDHETNCRIFRQWWFMAQ